MAAPGSTHYGYYFISYEFVYVGNRHGKFNTSQRGTLHQFRSILMIFISNSSSEYSRNVRTVFIPRGTRCVRNINNADCSIAKSK